MVAAGLSLGTGSWQLGLVVLEVVKCTAFVAFAEFAAAAAVDIAIVVADDSNGDCTLEASYEEACSGGVAEVWEHCHLDRTLMAQNMVIDSGSGLNYRVREVAVAALDAAVVKLFGCSQLMIAFDAAFSAVLVLALDWSLEVEQL